MKVFPVVSIVGQSGAGKTTFLEKLIGDLKTKNIRVGINPGKAPRPFTARPGYYRVLTIRHVSAIPDTSVIIQ